MKIIPLLAFILIILGALNWGLVGLGMLMGNQNWNVIAHLFDQWPEVLFGVYLAIGIAAVFAIFDWYSSSNKKK